MPIFGAVNSFIQAGKQKKMAKKIKPVNAFYKESEYIKDLYGEGANLYKGRMAGASAAEQNIAQNAASTNAIAERNAGDASTLLAYAAGTQGAAGEQYSNLAVNEAQDKQRRFGIYSNVSQLMAQEGDKVFQDKLRNYYDDLNYKRALEGASMQNKANAWGGLDKAIMGGVSLLAPGGALAGAFGGGGNNAGGGGQSPSVGVWNGRTNYGGYQGSDIRLKENYHVIGKSPSGINIYEFSYKGNSKRYQGVMANEVMWATQNIDGYLYVDYSLTDVQFKQV